MSKEKISSDLMHEVIIGKNKLADNHKHPYEQVCTYMKAHGKPETAKGRAWHMFQKLCHGAKPKRTWNFDGQPNVPITKAVSNHIKHHNMAYYHAMKKVRRSG